jgi:deazaflavin-dependent oxidoreductase (nitroreductase family)
MGFRRRLARFNKVVTNRIQGTWAWRLAPWVVVLHRGRRSGRTYRTPVMGHVGGGRVHVGVLYGEQSDWVRNVLAAGGGAVTRSGVTRELLAPRLLSGTEVRALPPAVRASTLRAGTVLVGELGEEIARGNPAALTLPAR